MSDYTSTFTENTGDTIDVADFTAEFNAIQTAVATKADTDSDTLTNLTIGSGYAGSVITADTVQTPSGVTTVDFTSIPSWVKRITLMLDGFTVTGADTPILTLGDSGGLEATGYIGGVTSLNENTDAIDTTFLTTGFRLVSSGDLSATSTTYGSVVLDLLDGTNNTWVLQGSLVTDDTIDLMHIVTGTKSLSATLDRIRITTSTNITGGSVNINYEG